MRRVSIILATLAMLLLNSCNRQVIDLKYKFSRARINWLDGTVKEVKVAKWRDYVDSDQVQVIDEDGTVYYTHSMNVILIKTKD